MNSPNVTNSPYFFLIIYFLFLLFVERIEIQMKKKNKMKIDLLLWELFALRVLNRDWNILHAKISHWIPATYFILSLISLFACTHTVATPNNKTNQHISATARQCAYDKVCVYVRLSLVYMDISLHGKWRARNRKNEPRTFHVHIWNDHVHTSVHMFEKKFCD